MKNVLPIWIMWLSLLTTACSDLSVFVPPPKTSNLDGVSSVALDDEGKLQLEWTLKSGSTNGRTYNAYLLELEPTDQRYNFTSAAITSAPLKSETLQVPFEESPLNKGTLAASASDLSLSLPEILKPDRMYLLQLVEKRKATKGPQTALLLKVDFKTNVPGTAKTLQNEVIITWTAVPGANHYEVYADESMTLLLGESDVNELALALKVAQIYKTFYIRPLRGALASKEVFKIDLSESDIGIVKVKADKADGRYTIGQTLDFDVTFDKAVHVFGDASLLLKMDTITRKASYLSGSNTNKIKFRYTIQAGDDATLLDNETVLEGEYTDTNGLSISASIPAFGSGATLKENSSISIDATRPTAPAAPGFNVAATTSGSLTLSWGPSVDTYFRDYSVKLCSDSGCSIGCGTEEHLSATSKSFSGASEGTYYGCVQARDESDLKSAWASSLTPVTIDMTGPSVVRVAALNDGIYKEGQTVRIAIKFSEIVSASRPGDLRLKLETGSVDREALYASGSGSDTLIFEYIPQLGDSSSDLNYFDVNALTLGATGLIKDSLNNIATLTLPATNNANSLAGQSQVAIDTTSPTSPTAITLPGSQSTSTSIAVSWTNSTDVNFKEHHVKLCGSNDCTTSCTTEVTALSSPATLTGVNNTTVYACVRGADVVGHLTAWSVSSSNIAIDSTAPSVVKVSASTANGVFKENDTLSLIVEFDETVVVTGGSDVKLLLETGTTDHQATYVSGSGSNILTFEYTVVAGDTSANLNYQNANALTIGSSTIKDAAGNNADLTLPAPASSNSLANQKALSLDTSVPTAPFNVGFDSATSNSTTFQVNFGVSTDAHLDTHNLKLCSDNLCSTGCSAVTQSSFSPATLSGTDGQSYYACVQGIDTLGHETAWIASSSQITIDTTAAGITDVTSAKADGIYKTADVIDITVTFSENVTVTGGSNISLALDTTPSPAHATYLSGSGSSILTFRYTVQDGENTSDLQYSSLNALTLGAGAAIKDSAGNDATLTLPALAGASLGAQKAFIIDTTPPTNPSAVGFGSSLSNTTSLNLSWSVSVDTNFSTHHAKLCSSSDCTTGCLTPVDSAGASATLIGVDNATYYGCVQGEDSAGLLSDWVSSVSSIAIDATQPVINSVTSTKADGSYKVGETIPVQVVFSKPVYVTNDSALSLLMETGTPDRPAPYTSGSGTNTLTFTYTVQAGDTSADLNYTSVSALDLGGSATISDAAGSAAVLTLPDLTTGQSLAVTKAIIIDTTAPVAPAITVPADGSTVGTVVTSISGTSEANAEIEVKKGATVLGTTTASGTSWSLTLSPALADGTYTVSAKATDAAGNTSPASSDTTFIVDTVIPSAPVVASLTTPTTDTTPTVTGTSEAGMTIKVYADATLIGSTTADGSGNWSITSSLLADGDYTITAIATDILSRDSAASNGVPISIDTTNPPAPLSASFAGPTTTVANFPLSWTVNGSPDPHHLQYNTKLCDTSACNGTCISMSSSTDSPTDMLGEDDGTYYGCVQAEDSLGHVSAWVATPSTIFVDTVGATILSVTSSTADGVYTTGQTLQIEVKFSENVIVTGGSPTNLTLKLETGTTDHLAEYASGSGSDTLVFTYVVQAGDASNDLNYFSTTSLVLSGGATIQDGSTNNAILTLPPLSSSNALKGQKAIRLDTTIPSAPGNVGFASTTVNSTTFTMTWTAGSDANFLRYNTKICTNQDCATDCTSSGDTTGLSQTMTGVAGTTYYGCVQMEDAVALKSAYINSVQSITVDTSAPTISGVSSSKANGAYKAGEIIPIEVTFTEPVYVLVPADVKLKLETGATDRVVSYTSGTGTNTLVFEYTVQATDTSADLNVFDANSLTVTPGGSIRDAAGNNATLTLATSGAGSLSNAKDIEIDTTAPLAPVIITPANNAYSMTDITTVSGTSETNATITLKNGSTTIGTTTASGTSWSITLSSALSDGIYSLTATAADAAGNVSPSSSANAVTVDTSAPQAPVINALTTPSTNNTPTISGTSEPNMSITIYEGSTQIATATANASGNWTATSSLLSDGVKSISATATDPGPRTSAASAAISYTVDTTLPTDPSNVAFSSPYSTSTSVAVSWTASTDANFVQHQIKQCTDSSCLSCGSSTNVAGNSTTLTVTAGQTIWACVRGQDAVNQRSAWVASTTSVTVDQSAPSVVSVSSNKTNGAYKVGDIIDINVNFNENVVLTSSGSISLLLETGTTDRAAPYHSGDGTSTLVFRYTVQTGDTSPDLDYQSTTALQLGGGTIKDLAGNTATLTLATPGQTGSLANAKALVIDTTAPTNPGSVSFPASITNATTLALSWSAASDTNLSRYNTMLCADTGCSSSCIDTANTTSLNQNKTGVAGSTYYGCVQAQDTAGNLSSWVASGSISIDQTAPTVTNVTSTKADGSYKAGVTIPITVTFSKVVTVTGTGVSLLLETGTTDQNVSLTSGSGSNTLTFNYVVQAGDTSADLNYQSASALTPGSATIKDSAGNSATLTLPWSPSVNTLAANKALVIDTTAPSAPVITTPSASYSMTNITTVSGTSEANASITIKDGSTTVGTATANASGNWSSTLSTTLTDGDHSLTAIATDAAGNVSTASATRSVTVDTTGPNAPVLNTFTSPTNVTTPTFSGTSEPNMSITLYQGSTSIGTTTADGSGVWSLNSSTLAEGTYTITAKATDPGPRTSAASNSRSITIDTTAPIVTGVTSATADGSFGIGATIPIRVSFSETVYTSGTPTLKLETGTTDAVVDYSSGSASQTLQFDYTVASPQVSSDLDYHSTTALSGTIKDAAGNSANLALATPGATNSLGANKNFVIDGVAPTVLSVSSTNGDGSWGATNNINITVTFSENIAVTGTPTLALNTTPARNASFLSLSGAVATFRYTIQTNDTSSDLDYASTSALSLSGGTIKDTTAGNNAVLTLPTVGGASSLGGSKNLVIVGGSVPPVLSATPSPAEAYVGTQTIVDVNNNTGNDATNDGRALNYICHYDTTANSAMDSGGTSCSSLPGTVSFNTTTGVLTWTPDSTANSSYTNYTTYELRVIASNSANTSNTLYTTVKVIRPWTKTVDYLNAQSAQYTFNTSEIAYAGGKVALKAQSQTNGPSDSTWDNVLNTGVGFMAGEGRVRLNTANCMGDTLNCAGMSHTDWIPLSTYRIFNSTFSNKTGFSYNADTDKQPSVTTAAKRGGGNSMHFDGNDYLYTSRIVQDTFAVSFWIKTNQSYTNSDCSAFHHGTGLVFADASGQAKDWGISMCDGYLLAGVGSTTSDVTIKTEAQYNDNNWHHVYMGRSKAGSFTFWVDDLLIATSTNSANLSLSDPTTIYYGSRSATSGFYVGYMDELIIYDGKTLNSTELGELYDRQASRFSGSALSRIFDGQAAGTSWNSFKWKADMPYGKELPDGTNETTANYPSITTNLMSNIAGIWHFNETAADTAPSGKDFADTSGKGMHAVAQGSMNYGARGRFGNGVRLRGAGEISLGNAFDFGTGSFTIAAWYKTYKLPTNNNFQILAQNGFDASGYANGFRLSIWRDKLNFGFCKTSGSAAACPLVDVNADTSDGNWHHVMVSVNRSNSTFSVYIDGSLASITKPGSFCGTVTSNVMDFSACSGLNASKSLAATYLGSAYVGSTRSNPFVGTLDEVAGWSRALSAAEAKHLFLRGGARVHTWMRTCTAADCSDEPAWRGPDGNNFPGFSELNNNSAPVAGTGTVSNTAYTISTADYPSTAWGTNRYFQYQIRLESDDSNQLCDNSGTPVNCSPYITNVEVGPDHYPTKANISWNTATPFYNVSSFTEILGSGGCSSGVRYKFSLDNASWKSANSGVWSDGAPPSTGNTQTYLDSTGAKLFGAQIGRNQLYVQAVLYSNGLTPCELDSFTMGGNDFYD